MPPTGQPFATIAHALHALQARRGASATTCPGTATILAAQGNASQATVQWRETTVQRLCVEDSWPEVVRQCVATADHDPLSCTGHLDRKLKC